MGMMIRVDWFALMTDLHVAGFSGYDVADQTDIPRTTLLDWKRGSEPRHADGERLICFWVAATGQPRDSVPMAQDLPSASKVLRK